MKPAEYLHHLVQSMSRTEKSYFKRYASVYSSGKEQHYLKLFDAVNAQPEYDESAIKKGAALAKNLPQTKGYLYNMILDSLHAYQTTHNIENKLHRQIEHALILKDRGLHIHAKKILQKAKQEAVKHEKFLMEAEIVKAQLSVLGVMEKEEPAKTRLFFLKQQQQALEKEANLNAYKLLQWEIVDINSRKGFALTEADKKTLETFLQNPLLKDKNLALSVLAQSAYYYTLTTIYYMLGNLQALSGLYKEYLLLAEKHTGIIGLSAYLGIVMNSINVLMATGQLNDMKAEVARLKSIALPDNKEGALLSKHRTLMLLNCLTKTGDFTGAKTLIGETAAAFSKTTAHISDGDRLYFQLYQAQTYIWLNDFQDALDVVNQLLQHKLKNLNPDIYLTGKWLNILVHSELGNHQIVETELRSARRLFKQAAIEDAVEPILTKLFTKLCNATYFKKREALYRNAEKEIAKFRTSQSKSMLLGYFDFGKWFESRRSASIKH